MASAFLQGFTGGMNAVGNMINAREERDLRRDHLGMLRENMEFNQNLKTQQAEREQEIWNTEKENLAKQEALYKTNAFYTFRGGLDKKDQDELDGKVIDRFNEMPAVQQALARNVEPGTKKILSKKTMFQNDRLIPFVDVVNEETGDVIRSRPLTDQGKNDGSDNPMSLGIDDLIETTSHLGLGDFGLQMERDMMARGAPNPRGQGETKLKVDSWQDVKGNHYRTDYINGKYFNFKNGVMLDDNINLGFGGDGDNDEEEETTDPEAGTETPDPESKQSSHTPTFDLNQAHETAMEELYRKGPGLEQLGNAAGTWWDKTKRGVANSHNMATANNAYQRAFRGNGKHLNQDKEAMAYINAITEQNGGKVPDYQQTLELFQKLKRGDTAQPDSQPVNQENSIGYEKNILIDAAQALEQGGEEALRQYMDQYDEHTQRKVAQELIKQRGFNG